MTENDHLANGGVVTSGVDADHPPAWLGCRHSEVCAHARPQRHVISFHADGTWRLVHPADCDAFPDCQVRRLAEQQLPARSGLTEGRYECWVGDLGDVFLLGDRIDQAEG